MYLYVELWSARQAWLNLPAQERQQFFENVGSEIEKLTNVGIEIIGFAVNDENTPQGTDHRYMAVWKMPCLRHAEKLEESVAQAGWYNYFEQVNARGERIAPEVALADMSQLESPAV